MNELKDRVKEWEEEMEVISLDNPWGKKGRRGGGLNKHMQVLEM